MRIAEASPESTKPIRCAHFGKCGGCDHLDIHYRIELEQKRLALGAMLEQSPLSRFRFLPTRKAREPLFYRTALKVPFGKVGERVVSGFFKPGTHGIVDLNECAIQHPTLTRILRRTRELASKHRVPIYHEHVHKGLLRHLVARVGDGTGEILAGLVVRRGGAPQVAKVARDLLHEFAGAGLVGVVENENPVRTNVILGEQTKTLVGRGELREEIEGLNIQTSLATFAQVNAGQARVLYEDVLEALAPIEGKRLVDLYSGYGPIALRAARAGANVTAIERNADAVRDGRRAAAENGLQDRIEFVTGDAGAELRKRAIEGLDAVVVDPPRRGLTDATVALLGELRVPRFVYVSCDPVTLIRDLELLSGVYRLESLRPIDLFPRTAHLECVAVLAAR